MSSQATTHERQSVRLRRSPSDEIHGFTFGLTERDEREPGAVEDTLADQNSDAKRSAAKRELLRRDTWCYALDDRTKLSS